MGFLVAMMNVVDLHADRIVLSKEYVAKSSLRSGQTAIDVGGFGLHWRPRGSLGVWSVDAPVTSKKRLLLSLTPVQPYVLNGPRGIVREGSGARSAYYSNPRLAARGTLVLDGRPSQLRAKQTAPIAPTRRFRASVSQPRYVALNPGRTSSTRAPGVPLRSAAWT
jgi:hypothetical protein